MTRRRTSKSEDSRDELSRLLLALRGSRLQVEAAELTGLSQVKVSRAERGRYPMRPDEAEAYARALGATDAQALRVLQLANAKIAHHQRSRVSLVRVWAAIQERIGQLEDESTLIRGWLPIGLHRALQTEDYTRALLAGEGADDPGPEWWAARQRGVARLVEPGREWHLIVSEAVLRWTLGSRAVMADQLAHLADLSQGPTLRLGIIPLDGPHTFLPSGQFHLYDDTVVSVPTSMGSTFVEDPVEIAEHAEIFDRLAGAALFDDDAQALLERIRRGYRRR